MNLLAAPPVVPLSARQILNRLTLAATAYACAYDNLQPLIEAGLVSKRPSGKNGGHFKYTLGPRAIAIQEENVSWFDPEK